MRLFLLWPTVLATWGLIRGPQMWSPGVVPPLSLSSVAAAPFLSVYHGFNKEEACRFSLQINHVPASDRTMCVAKSREIPPRREIKLQAVRLFISFAVAWNLDQKRFEEPRSKPRWPSRIRDRCLQRNVKSVSQRLNVANPYFRNSIFPNSHRFFPEKGGKGITNFSTIERVVSSTERAYYNRSEFIDTSPGALQIRSNVGAMEYLWAIWPIEKKFNFVEIKEWNEAWTREPSLSQDPPPRSC